MGGSPLVGLDLDPQNDKSAAEVVDRGCGATKTQAGPRGGARANDRAGDDWRQPTQGASGSERRFKFPLRTRQEVTDYLATLEGEVELFAFEFSGAAVSERARMGKQVFAVDLRAPEHGQPCYQGDVRDVIDLRVWAIAWFLGPNCFQHMRKDDCATQKASDGRAFWGVAMVEWCLDCAYAKAIVMEQPDTIAHDFIDMAGRHTTCVVEFRTSWLGDKRNKFIRLTMVNMGKPKLTGLMSQSRKQIGGGSGVRMRGDDHAYRPKHTDYPNADARDRDRSSWLPLVNTTKWVTRLEARPGKPAAPDEYVKRIRVLGQMWRDSGRYLPPDYDNPDAQPTSQLEREYQLVRGPGRGAAAPTQATRSSTAVIEKEAVATASNARRAEPGDQRVASDVDSAFLSVVSRRVREGASLVPGQQAKLDNLVADESRLGPLFFWSEKLAAGEKGCLSNYFTSDFQDEGLMDTPQPFNSVEQYMHWAKALISADYKSASLIRDARDPAECRRLGRLIQGYDVS